MSTDLLHRALIGGVRPAGTYKVIALESPDIARAARPGQFVTIGLEPAAETLLRRPFSIYRAYADTGLVEIAFDVIGLGTRWIAEQRSCLELDVAGPLGNGFTIEPGITNALLVGGGYGTSALYQLAVELRAAGVRTHLLSGAATSRRVFAPERDLFDAVTITTDDGSEGTRGFVTEAMTTITDCDAVFACGPMAMLAAVSRAARGRGVPVQVATEEFMACGIGVCWTCVVPVRTDTGLMMRRCCTDGPVFDGAAVEWR